MVPLDDGPAVDRQDVALLQPVVAGDAVDDHVVGRGADDGREPVVAEEVRRGPPALEHLSGHGVELVGRHPGPQRRPGGLVHLGHHPPGPAHLGQLVGVAPHQGPPAMPSADPRRRSSTAETQSAGHLVGGAGAVDLGQLAPALVPLDQRRRLALVELEAAPDGLLGVVLALDHLAAADVAGPVDHGRRRGRVVGPAVHADPPRGQPLQDQLGGDLEVDHQVEPVGLEDVGQSSRPGRWSAGSRRARTPGPGCRPR